MIGFSLYVSSDISHKVGENIIYKQIYMLCFKSLNT